MIVIPDKALSPQERANAAARDAEQIAEERARIEEAAAPYRAQIKQYGEIRGLFGQQRPHRQDMSSG